MPHIRMGEHLNRKPKHAQTNWPRDGGCDIVLPTFQQMFRFEISRRMSNESPDCESSEQSCSLRLARLTLRIGNPGSSLRLYQHALGMRLLSRQVISEHQFTLYFLACTDESPPDTDIDAVANREWLWQRPYTTLELQHVWRRDWQGLTNSIAADAGFRHISFATRDLRRLVKQADQALQRKHPAAWSESLAAMTATVRDPDGNAVRMIQVD